MAVSAGVINKRAAASDVYTMLYSINKGRAECGAYGGTGTPLLWYDSSVSTHTREYHLTMSAHTRSCEHTRAHAHTHQNGNSLVRKGLENKRRRVSKLTCLTHILMFQSKTQSNE